MLDKTKVMIADDHALFRAGLRGLLEETGEFEVVAAVSACFVFVFFFSNCRVASKILIATWSVVASVKDTVQRRRASLDKRRRCI